MSSPLCSSLSSWCVWGGDELTTSLLKISDATLLDDGVKVTLCKSPVNTDIKKKQTEQNKALTHSEQNLICLSHDVRHIPGGRLQSCSWS